MTRCQLSRELSLRLCLRKGKPEHNKSTATLWETENNTIILRDKKSKELNERDMNLVYTGAHDSSID